MRFGLPVAVASAVAILSFGISGAEPLGNGAVGTKISPFQFHRRSWLRLRTEMAIWRCLHCGGAAPKVRSGTAMSSSGGGGQDGTLSVSLRYGSVDANLLFQPAMQRLTVHGTSGLCLRTRTCF